MTTGFSPNFEDGAGGVPWGESMGPNLQDNATGVFWGAFTLFACTTASIMSGSVIERIRMGAFIRPRGGVGLGGVDSLSRLGLAPGRLDGDRLGLP